MNEYRTHKCDELRERDIGKKVKLSGFVKTIRDLGALIFVTLRDHYGITQLVINDENKQNEFRNLALDCICPSHLPICQCDKESLVKVITRKPILPTKEEIEENPRSRSAKLRVAERV